MYGLAHILLQKIMGLISMRGNQQMHIEIKDAINYACNRIESAKIELYPSPHFYIKDVFPPKFYEKIKFFFPDISNLLRLKNSPHGNHEIDENRFYLSVRDGDLGRLNGNLQAFWEEFSLAVARSNFETVVFNKFFQFIDLPRYLILGKAHDLSIIGDRGGYEIKPHTDTPQRLYTLIFYCPEDLSQKDLGTSLYRKRGHDNRRAKPYDSWFRFGADPYLDFNLFDKVSTVDFLPNSLFGFVRTRYSYHGVDKTSDDALRRMIMYHCFSSRSSRRLGSFI
jgi:hypothetical protein